MVSWGGVIISSVFLKSPLAFIALLVIAAIAFLKTARSRAVGWATWVCARHYLLAAMAAR